MAKASSLLAANNGHPTFYIKLLCDLEDMVTSSLKDKVGFKKLSAANGRSLNRMKLAFRKYIKVRRGGSLFMARKQASN